MAKEGCSSGSRCCCRPVRPRECIVSGWTVHGGCPRIKGSLAARAADETGVFPFGSGLCKAWPPGEARAALKKLDELNRSEIPEQEKKTTREVTPKPEQLR